MDKRMLGKTGMMVTPKVYGGIVGARAEFIRTGLYSPIILPMLTLSSCCFLLISLASNLLRSARGG
jgi:hypothetical protein